MPFRRHPQGGPFLPVCWPSSKDQSVRVYRKEPGPPDKQPGCFSGKNLPVLTDRRLCLSLPGQSKENRAGFFRLTALAAVIYRQRPYSLPYIIID